MGAMVGLTGVLVRWAVLAMLGAGWGGVEPGAAANPGVDEARVDALLQRLYQRGQDLREFEAKVALSETDASTGAGSVRAGTVSYAKEAAGGEVSGVGGGTRLRVRFETRAEDDGPARAERLEYLLDGAWLTERNYRRKVEIRRQLLRPGQTMNLFRLGEGPFPLPIGQPPAEVRGQFEVSLLPAELGGGDGVLRLVPREGTRLWTRFATIDVWVDAETGFPVKIETLNRQETTVRTTELRELRLNPSGGLKPETFVLEGLDDTWKRSEEPFEEG